MISNLKMEVLNTSVFGNTTLTAEAMQTALSSTLGVSSSKVRVLQVRGGSYSWPSWAQVGPKLSGARRLEKRDLSKANSSSLMASLTGWKKQFESGDLVVENGDGYLKFAVERMPDSFMPDSIVGQSSALATAFNTQIGTDSALGSVSFTPWPPTFLHENTYKTQIKEEYQQAANEATTTTNNKGKLLHTTAAAGGQQLTTQPLLVGQQTQVTTVAVGGTNNDNNNSSNSNKNNSNKNNSNNNPGGGKQRLTTTVAAGGQ